jgi:nucleoside-diphosphate-sugar epimerase
MRILITGITGYIGSNLAKSLRKHNHSIVGIIRKDSDLFYLKRYCIDKEISLHVDNGEGGSLKGVFEVFRPEIVFHLAAYQKINNFSVSDLITSNILFATQLLEAMVSVNCLKLVNSSSYFQYYENSYNPNSLYAASKQAFEDICLHYKNNEAMSITNLILYDNYGVGDQRKKLLNLCIEKIKNNETLDLTWGYQQISLTYIDDLVDAYLCAMNLIIDRNYQISWHYSVMSNYRKNTIMFLKTQFEILPNWHSKVSLSEGIKLILEKG